MADLHLSGITDEIPAYARTTAAVRSAAARYIRRACPDAVLILSMLDLEEP